MSLLTSHPRPAASRNGRSFPLLPLCAALFVALFLSVPAASAQETTGVAVDQYAGEPVGAEGPDAALPEEVDAPEIEARSWIVTDAESGETLAGANVSEEAPMASTTKIMTALVVLENADLEEEVTVSENAASYAVPEYSNAGLQEGDVLTVRDMLEATLVVSGGDAATALAEHVGGDVPGFVEMMNAEAERLGLEETSFTNPIGLDGREHYSSARDLASLARTAMEDRLFRRIVSTESTSVTTSAGREIPLSNLNELLYTYPPATGIKTGTTPKAGPSLVASAVADGEDYIAVVLDAPDRYGEATRILDYGFAAYDSRPLVVEGDEYDSTQAPYRRDEEIPIVAAGDVEGLVDSDSRIKVTPTVMDELPPSARRGDRLGEVIVTVDGERVGETPLLAGVGYEEAPVWQRIWYSVSSLWNE